MGFDSGTISFRRFAVVGGSLPDAIDQPLLDRLAENVISEHGLATPEIDHGFSGGRHVLDTRFTFENNVFADALHLGLRIDTNKPPAELLKAYQIIEEDSSINDKSASGFVPRSQKRSSRAAARDRIEQEARSGRFRRSKLYSILWDPPAGTICCNVSGDAQDRLIELFQRALDLEIEPLSAGSLALRMLEDKGSRRDYEDSRPTRFVSGPDGEGQSADYPWVAKGPQAKDFLGNEFLLWLWQQVESKDGVVETAHGPVTIFFDRTLDLDCVFGSTGRDLLRATGVSRMPEAIDALRSGKVPRKAGLLLQSQGIQYSLTLAAESFGVSSLKLPEVEDPANPRVLFEERIALLRDFNKLFDSLYASFLTVRASSKWEGQTAAVRQWIKQPRKQTLAGV